MVRDVKEATGYDREAYEHELNLGRTKSWRPCQSAPSVSQTSSKSTYIFEFEGPLNTAETVQQAAGVEARPAITTGAGDLGEACFASVDTSARDAIVLWLSKKDTSFRPTFVRVSKSGKDLCHYSMCPTLGLDTTLPQYRPVNLGKTFVPTQKRYPVWYFFYGNLAVPDILSRRLALTDAPVFTPATITGGMTKKWRGKYNAPLDSRDTQSACVHGWAHLVETEEHEDALRLYETENYEIVRCPIKIEGMPDAIKGLTFRL